jgi:hypothetical protein
MPIWISLLARQRWVRRPVAAFSCLNSFGCMRKTNRVRVLIGWMVSHQQRCFGQKQR